MKHYYVFLILTLLLNNIPYSQANQQFGKIFKKSENEPPVADAGEDIKVSPGGTVTINGDKSGDPNGDALQFEWSLPPSLMEKENYVYDLVYNPEITVLQKKALQKGAKVKNGLEMMLKRE